MGYNDSKYLLEEAGDRFEICPVAVDLSAGRRLSDEELKILTEQKCVIDALNVASSAPYYIIFESTLKLTKNK